MDSVILLKVSLIASLFFLLVHNINLETKLIFHVFSCPSDLMSSDIGVFFLQMEGS